MLCDLLIDGNYILSRCVFTLHKHNLLYGALYKSLENTVNNYRKWYPFANVYLISDSKEKSWRKQIYVDYKSTRKKDTDIDWGFVYSTYSEFKNSMKGLLKVLEAPSIEGDDLISFLIDKANKSSRSTIVVSNDYDIKQLISYSIDPLYINVMTNEMYNKEKIFLPQNYQVFLNKVSKLDNNDIFNLNDNSDFVNLMMRFVNSHELNEINPVESLFIKIISGDVSDNIKSAWSQVKNGKKRGIGHKGAKTIYDEYVNEFGDVNFDDPDLYENIADLICDKKKLSKTQMPSIVENIQHNIKLIDLRLSNLPIEITEKMESIYASTSLQKPTEW